MAVGWEEVRGAISLAILASMNMINVKATLWTGAEDKISRIQDCGSVSVDMDLLAVFMCKSSCDQSSVVMIPS